MKKLFLLLMSLTSFGLLNAQHINEFHYDDASGDSDEFIEVFIPDGDENSYCIVLYNGSNGTTYDTDAVPATCPTGTGAACDATGPGCFIVINYPTNGIQNGDPDGIALVQDCGGAGETVIEFISYEGTMTATNGPANGMMSTDIGASEDGTPEGQTLQKTAAGTWESGVIATDGACNTAQLPVELISFEGSAKNKNVDLAWQTASEENNSHFEVEHSTNGRDFQMIDKVNGNGTSAEIQTYQFTHTDAVAGKNYYRLRQVDFDGAFEYSSVAVVTMKTDAVIEVRPTMVASSVQVVLEEGLTTEVALQIVDITGRQLQTATIAQGTQQFDLEVSDLDKGAYFIQFNVAGEVITRRFVKM